jgi:ribonucleoside-diphosphate reductase beta chain
VQHTSFVTTTRGLRRSSSPMRLYEKAKRLGVWNPSDLDFRQDIIDWNNFGDDEKKVLLHLTSLFQAGEEAVTGDILPLILVIASEGRLEEEMYLTTFLFEEGKHTDFFRRFLDEVAQEHGDLSHFSGDNYRSIIYETLPQVMGHLRGDPSPAAQIEAAVTYNMIVEGVLAETGYHAYFSALERNNLMPGVRKGISLLKQDESRHIAYGVYLLSRLIAEHPDLWDLLEMRMNELFVPAVGVIADIFDCYDPMPFGLVAGDFANFAISQFNKRYERLEKARGASLEEVERVAVQVIETEDA